jgi:hypothetical protein
MSTTSTLQSEAEEYSQGSDRPLRGYLVVLSTLTAIAGIIGAVALRRGTRLARVTPYDLALMVAGTHKLSRTLAKDAVTSPLRAPFARYNSPGGPAELMEEPRKDSSVRHAVGELITCPFCLDAWIAGGFTVGLLFAPRLTRVIAAMFTTLAGADFLQLIYARLQQAAEGP